MVKYFGTIQVIFIGYILLYFSCIFTVKPKLSGTFINILQEWLGHSSIFTPSIYTQITGMDTSQFMNQIQ